MLKRLLQIYTFILLVIRIVFLFQQKHHGEIYANYDIYPNDRTTNTYDNMMHGAATQDQEYQHIDRRTNQDNLSDMLPADYIEKQANTELLIQLYEQQPDNNTLIHLINTLLSQHKFDLAYSYIEKAVQKDATLLDPHTHIYATFHAPSLIISQAWSIRIVEDLITDYRSQNRISADDYTFYNALIRFWHQDFHGAILLLKQIDSPKYEGIKDLLLGTFEKLARQRDIPAYYSDTIIALSLMRQWYYTIAKRIASNTVLQNKNYILPYQILAYSHFITQNWDTAIEYLLILRDLERKQAQRYTFLIGVAQYWQGEHTQAIMFLNQVNAPALMIDAQRYILLSYIQRWEHARAHATRQRLLWHPSITKNDFYTYFHAVFYRPLRAWLTADMYQTNTHTVHASIQQCFTILASDDHDICHYGNAWLALVRWQIQQAKDILDQLVDQYDSGYLFHALGDYYASESMREQAEYYYQQALGRSDNDQERSLLHHKIINLY